MYIQQIEHNAGCAPQSFAMRLQACIAIAALTEQMHNDSAKYTDKTNTRKLHGTVYAEPKH